MMVQNKLVEQVQRLQSAIYQCAVDHGFYQNDDGTPIDVRHPLMLSSRLALIHSEIDEAYEAMLAGEIAICLREGTGKPDGMIVELADTAIRCMDFAGSLNLDLTVPMPLAGHAKWKGFLPSEPLSIHLSVSRALEAVRDDRIETMAEGGLLFHLASVFMQCIGCGLYFGGDLWEAIEEKHEYNLKRPFKHGRKSL